MHEGLDVITVDAPHFNAGVFVDPKTNRIEGAAPILKWSIGWEFPMFERYARRKGWQILRAP